MNSIGIDAYHYVEFYVGSAKLSRFWYENALGFETLAYRGPETGDQDVHSYFMRKNNLRFVVTSAARPENYELTSFVTQHGDGVKRWSLHVDSVKAAFDKAVKNGAIPVAYPKKRKDALGHVEEASIKLYDDVECVFINDDHYDGAFKPGYQEIENKNKPTFDSGLKRIDHIVGNVRKNEMDHWAQYLNHALDFETSRYFGPGDISTRYSALLSTVVSAKDRIVRNPINEPFEAERQSQIEEYIDAYHGTGVQHIALHTDDIVSTLSVLRSKGVGFIEVPDSYYKALKKRVKDKNSDLEISENIADLKKMRILCDIEGEGYLLQTFTQPVGDRPTFFFEIIQRRQGAKGFGEGNFQALFESIEKEQDKRGHLTKTPKGRAS